MNNEQENEKLHTSYWAGRLHTHDQAWEVASEIVEEIDKWRARCKKLIELCPKDVLAAYNFVGVFDEKSTDKPMTPNIVFTDNKFLVTPLGEWPKKPEHCISKYPQCCNPDSTDGCKCYDEQMEYEYALSQSTPIVEADYEKIKVELIARNNFKKYGSEPSEGDFTWDCSECGTQLIKKENCSRPIAPMLCHPCWSKILIDGTVYKDTGLNLEPTCKWNGDRNACGNETCWDVYSSEGCQKSPLAYKVKV